MMLCMLWLLDIVRIHAHTFIHLIISYCDTPSSNMATPTRSHILFEGLQDYSYDQEKRPRRTAKPRRPAIDVPKERMSTYSVVTVLKNWSVQFLECCYNVLMKVVRVSV